MIWLILLEEISMINPAYHYSDKYKLAYVSIPKSGCTTFKNIMHKLDNPEYEYSDNPCSIHMHKIKQQRLEISKDYYKFTFVRNPIDRFLSFYVNKIIHFPEQGTHLSNILSSYGFYKNMSIISFFEIVEDIDPLGHEEHYAPQINFVYYPDNSIRTSFIGKLENVVNDWGVLKNKFGIKEDVFDCNQSGRSINLEDLTTREIDCIANFYERDLEYFKYEIGK